MIPSVKVNKATAGSVPSSSAADGILALIAFASAGALNQPGIYSNQALLTSAFGSGPLPEYGTYHVNVANRPCLAMRGSCTVAGSYGTIIHTGFFGTSTISAGGTAPFDHYAVSVNFLTGATVGTAGATYTYSVDGGTTTSAVQQLGTANTITIPNTGVSFSLGAGTIVAGDTFSVFTERPLMNNSDVSTSLAALGLSRLPWEGVLIDAQYASGLVGVVDTWLAGLETGGQFGFALLNTRFLNEPTPTQESAAAYAAAMITATQNDASDRVCVGADGGHVVSLITGYNIKRPTSLALGAMAMSLTPNIGTDPAYVGNGPVAGYQIDVGSNPNDWDEGIYQSLDSQRLVTLRSFATGGPAGVYITNANVLIPGGSSVVWLQYLRVLNKACGIAWAAFSSMLSLGVNTVMNQTTNVPNIDPRDAQNIEAHVNGPLQAGLAGQVTAAAFNMNRDDNLSSPTNPVGGQVSIVGKFYLKNVNVNVALVKTITVGGNV
jgi:hypothetical protein